MYARFEQTGQISFPGFINIARGLDMTEEIALLFSKDEDIIQW